MKAVVLAAGKGTRMWPLTETRPKPLLPVAGQTVVETVLDAAAPHVDGFVVVVGYRAGMIHDRLGERYRGLDVEYVGQDEQRGTGDAVRQAWDKVGARFLVLNGDLLVSPKAVKDVVDSEGDAVSLRKVENPSDYGVAEVEGGRLTGITEKPADPSSDLVNAGVYQFRREVFEVIDDLGRSERGEVELTDALVELEPEAVEYEGEWMDVGYPWDLLKAEKKLLERREREVEGEVAEDAVLEGEVVVEEGAEIRPGSVVEGPVLVEENASIGPNAYVRGPVTVGAGGSVGHGSEVKASLLMPDAKVPHQSYVGDSVLGEDVNLGAGTVVANLRHDGETVESEMKGEDVDTGRRKFGVVFGDEVRTGVNTSLNPGVKLAPESTTNPGDTVYEDVR